MATTLRNMNRSISERSLYERMVNIRDIRWDSEQHTILVGDITISLTPTEYRLLFPLRGGMPVTYADLAMLAYNYTVDEKVRTMMDKHIDRIRGKLRGSGVYVYCVLGYGYMLLPEQQTQDVAV